MKDISAGGLRFAGAKKNGNKVMVSFEGIRKGLEIRPGRELSWFELSADSKTWIKADAVIDGNSVVVSSSEVSTPKYVRMGWRNVATPNLQDKSGIPVFPFPAQPVK